MPLSQKQHLPHLYLLTDVQGVEVDASRRLFAAIVLAVPEDFVRTGAVVGV